MDYGPAWQAGTAMASAATTVATATATQPSPQVMIIGTSEM
jgi:hypothetical protein